MAEFLKKQRERAESKPLGRTENYYKYNEATGTGCLSQRRLDAAKNPPNVTAPMTPVGRTSGVCKPGHEADGERSNPPGYPSDTPAPSKRNRTP